MPEDLGNNGTTLSWKQYWILADGDFTVLEAGGFCCYEAVRALIRDRYCTCGLDACGICTTMHHEIVGS